MWTLRWTSVLHLNLQTLRLHSTMILTVAAQCPLILRNVAYCKIIFFSYTQYMKQMLFLITDLPAEFFFLVSRKYPVLTLCSALSSENLWIQSYLLLSLIQSYCLWELINQSTLFRVWSKPTSLLTWQLSHSAGYVFDALVVLPLKQNKFLTCRHKTNFNK